MSFKNPVTRPGIDPGTVRLVAQRLNHYATPDPVLDYTHVKKKKLSKNLPVKKVLWDVCGELVVADNETLLRQLCLYRDSLISTGLTSRSI
jgi:hypothetical protein